MMENELSKPNKTVFEQIKQSDENNNDWWSARQLGKILEYSEYRHFKPVIEKAKEACINSGQTVGDHFEDFLEMVNIGKKVRKTIEEIGGTMPENLPVTDSIKKLEKAKEAKLLKSPKKKK